MLTFLGLSIHLCILSEFGYAKDSIMVVKSVASKLYRDIVNNALAGWLERDKFISPPPGGWIFCIRKSLNMSGAQLARKLGVTRARVAKAERSELDGAITINSMRNIAEALGCKFVYAIVPVGDIDTVLLKQARKKAEAIIKTTNQHMALEGQELSGQKISYEIARLTEQLLRDMPHDFWEN